MPSCPPRIALCACALGLVGCVSRPAGQHADTRVAWAATPPGAALVRWLSAYNTGNPDSLRAFATREFAASELSRRPAEERAASDRWMHLNLGRMRVVTVDSLSDTTITATVFQQLIEGWGRVSVRVESAAPHRLISRRISFFDPAPPPVDPAKSSPFPDVRSDQALTASLDAYARRLVDADVFSGVVLVSRHGIVLFEKAYGLAQRAPNVPNDLERRFQLASVSKMFTAVAIARLVDQGKLSFHDTLAKLLPDYPNRETAGRITVGQLLTHTSGIPDYFRIPRFWESRAQLRTLGDYWSIFFGEPLGFTPGSRYEYSSSGYIILGAIIERITGEPFRDYISAHVFQPAGMKSTSYEDGTALHHRAVPYTKNFGPGNKPDPDHWHAAETPMSSLGMSSGGGTSTARDMARFMDALLQHRLLSAAMTDTILAQRVTDPEGGRSYGFESNIWNGVRIVGHNGFAPGTFNQVEAYPDLGYVTVVLSNQDTSGGGALSYWLRLQMAPAPIKIRRD
jgi:CubicO group peptidase (beta-lactamase class C family)